MDSEDKELGISGSSDVSSNIEQPEQNCISQFSASICTSGIAKMLLLYI